MSAEGGNKAVVAALLANTGIALTKFIAYLITHSASMLAESIHSLADAGNQVLLLVGAKRSKREATEEHPFGFGRERYIYAFIVSIVLFTVGGLYALYEAVHKINELRAGHEPEGNFRWISLVVLAIAMVMESFSFRTAIVESNKVRGAKGWVPFVRGAKAPELPVILLEDLAALTGLVIAFVGVSLTLLTGNEYFDVVGAGVIGVLLIVVAITLAIEVKSLLIGESATKEAIERIKAAILGTEGVEHIIHMKTLHIAPEELLVAVKIGIQGTALGADVAATIDAVERNLRAAEPMATQIFIEPDIYRADYVPEARPEAPSAPSH
ncbi:MAG: cation transporter [Nocardioidaceae bacterium]|nr:cation transporter [Nocardioidaceae bacterium]